jgi:ATP-dependent Clp protease ATP-binding subunit ClpA
VQAQVARIVGRGDEVATAGQIPFTPRAKEVLELSLREAMSLKHHYIGTEHLLLGLLREGEGVAARVLLDLGHDVDSVRNAVLGMLGGTVSPLPFPRPPHHHHGRRRHSPLTLIVAGWLMGAVTLGAGIAIGFFIWG